MRALQSVCVMAVLVVSSFGQFAERRSFDLDASVHPDLPLAINRVAQVGDVNFDGVADLAVSLHTTISNNFERLVLVSGADGTFIRQFNSPAGPGIQDFGSHIIGLPDLNGDGCDDLYVVASLQINGAIHVLSGLDGSAVGFLSASSNVFNFSIAYQSVDLGDLSDDGGKWLAFSVPDEIGPDPASPSSFLLDVGSVYIVRAIPGGGLSLVNMIQGQFWGQKLGSGLSSLGDVNGDGNEDIGIYSAIADTVGGVPSNFIIYDAITGAKIRGDARVSTKKLDDINGDGFDDYLSATGVHSGLDGTTFYSYAFANTRGCGDIDGDGIRDFMKNDAFHGGATGALLFGVNPAGGSTGLNLTNQLIEDHDFGDFDGDGFDDTGYIDFATGLRTYHVISHCGARRYGVTGGPLQTLELAWLAGGQSDPAIGQVKIDLGDPGGLGFVGVSLSQASFDFLGLDVVVDNAPGNVVDNLNFGFNAAGTLTAPAYIRSPFVAGVSFYFQAFQTFPSLACSNGLELRFVP